MGVAFQIKRYALTYASAEDREYFTKYIEKYGSQGANIFLLEYVDDIPGNRVLRDEIKAYCKERGYLYYISDSISLSSS